MCWLTVDPGISGTGWARFERDKLLSWGIIRSSCLTWQDRAMDIAEQLAWVVRGPNLPELFCEWPTGRFSSGAGIAAQNTDAILKLTFLIGAIQGLLDLPMTLIPVIKWKGQLPKIIVQKRAEVFFQKKGFKSHAADAVGIGQYIIKNKLLTATK